MDTRSLQRGRFGIQDIALGGRARRPVVDASSNKRISYSFLVASLMLLRFDTSSLGDLGLSYAGEVSAPIPAVAVVCRREIIGESGLSRVGTGSSPASGNKSCPSPRLERPCSVEVPNGPG